MTKSPEQANDHYVPYSIDLRAAARRHKEAADSLIPDFPDGRPDVAAYLYGIVAECALKEIMRECGMRPGGPRSEDPFYLHFPALKTVLRDSVEGRNHRRLSKYANDSSLLNGWDVAMRYAPTRDVMEQPIRTWRSQAERLLQDMESL